MSLHPDQLEALRVAREVKRAFDGEVNVGSRVEFDTRYPSAFGGGMRMAGYVRHRGNSGVMRIIGDDGLYYYRTEAEVDVLHP